MESNLYVNSPLALLNQFATIFIVLAIVWLIILVILNNRFLTLFKAENFSLWQRLGSPSLLKNNWTLYKFIFGQGIKQLSPSNQTWGRVLRYMIYLGVMLLLCIFIVIYQLAGV